MREPAKVSTLLLCRIIARLLIFNQRLHLPLETLAPGLRLAEGLLAAIALRIKVTFSSIQFLAHSHFFSFLLSIGLVTASICTLKLLHQLDDFEALTTAVL